MGLDIRGIIHAQSKTCWTLQCAGTFAGYECPYWVGGDNRAEIEKKALEEGSYTKGHGQDKDGQWLCNANKHDF